MGEKFLVLIRACNLGWVLMVNSILGIYIFPYLPQLMEMYGVTKDPNKIGYYAGVMGGALFFGRVFSSSLWGRCADMYGRIPCLVWSMVISGILNTAFTFTTNYYWALLIRLASGVSGAGLLIIGRALMTEIAPSNYKSLTVSIGNSFWQLGSSVGAFIGGHFLNLGSSQPFLAPGLVTTGISAISIPIILFGLRETLKKEELSEEDPEYKRGLKPKEASPDLEMSTSVSVKSPDTNRSEESTLIVVDPLTSATLNRRRASGPPKKAQVKNNLSKKPAAVVHELGFWEDLKEIFDTPNLVKAILAYSIFIYFQSLMSQTISNWLNAPFDKGGFDMEAREVGNIMAITGIPQLILQVALYSFFANKYGDVTLTVWVTVINIPSFLAFPLGRTIFTRDEKFFATVYFMVFWLIRVSVSSLGYSALQRIINDSVRMSKRGRVNGWLASISSVSQGLGPPIGGSMVAWSLNNNLGFPFDYYFVFMLNSLVCVFMLVFCVFRLDRRRIMTTKMMIEVEESKPIEWVKSTDKV